MKGYLNNDKATADTVTADGWLHSGDIGKTHILHPNSISVSYCFAIDVWLHNYAVCCTMHVPVGGYY